MNTRLAVFQMESVLGNIAQNAQKILDACEKSADAEILITPELALTGNVGDDFFNADFFNQVQCVLNQMAQEVHQNLPHLSLIVGTPILKNNALLNAAVLLQNGKIAKIHAKKPEHWEKRYFSGTEHADFYAPIFVKDLIISFSPPPLKASVVLKAQALNYAQNLKIAPNQIFLNRLGLDLPFIFEGQSTALDENAQCIWRAPAFEENLALLSLQNGKFFYEGDDPMLLEENTEQRIWQALVFALKRYFERNGFQYAVLGLSGGIDSGVVLALAVQALGKDKVKALILPSPFTSQESLEDAHQLAQNLNITPIEIPILPLMNAYEKALAKTFKKIPEPAMDTTFENLQARIRGQLIMAYANRTHALVLNTSNKSECAVGYSTLYGDLIGGISPIKDVLKTQIFALARYCNQKKEIIPLRMIEKAPSAELKPNQKDEDSLPPYPLLDAFLKSYIEESQPFSAIVQNGINPKTAGEILNKIKKAEFKRRQAPAGFLVSLRGFDYNFNFPIENAYGHNEQN